MSHLPKKIQLTLAKHNMQSNKDEQMQKKKKCISNSVGFMVQKEAG